MFLETLLHAIYELAVSNHIMDTNFFGHVFL